MYAEILCVRMKIGTCVCRNEFGICCLNIINHWGYLRDNLSVNSFKSKLKHPLLYRQAFIAGYLFVCPIWWLRRLCFWMGSEIWLWYKSWDDNNNGNGRVTFPEHLSLCKTNSNALESKTAVRIFIHWLKQLVGAQAFQGRQLSWKILLE